MSFVSDTALSLRTWPAFFLAVVALLGPQVSAAPQFSDPKIGLEFEQPGALYSRNSRCTLELTKQAKWKNVQTLTDGQWSWRYGNNWKLTGENIPGGIKGEARFEYIVGPVVLRTNDFAEAATAVANDVLNLPFGEKDGRGNPIYDYRLDGLDDCNDWTLGHAWVQYDNGQKGFHIWDGPDACYDMLFETQLTAATPLSGYWRLAKHMATKANNQPLWENLLWPDVNARKAYFSVVVPELFAARPNDMSARSVQNNLSLLGFLSFVVNVAESAHRLPAGKSTKHFMLLMPRTDFVTMYWLVAKDVKGDLWKLVKHLICHRVNSKGKAVLDSSKCSTNMVGTLKLDKEHIWKTADGRHPLDIKDWVRGIQEGRDLLQRWDKDHYNGQVGGFGNKLEYLDGSTNQKEAAVIIEYRGLKEMIRDEIPQASVDMESAIIDLHRLDMEDRRRAGPS
ncbi:hypothetical protein BDV95DRAFT_564354 [Massariosphaeria phaeospora]|uniref:Uncharacterized protein n=1 Tax=Massariosphaeria phaeospora TaxID=100035 RepID=A0A7C8MCV2_9PLEO|nr:hypothetical protein BDV95DRAFT_564354 [Massariosphaeria phaeospora]